jgi:hypothetical protein
MKEERDMYTKSESVTTPRFSHKWLKKLRIVFIPGESTPLLDEFSSRLMERFEYHGHQILSDPKDDPDVLITTARFGKALNWRKSMLLTARIRYKLDHSPTVVTLVHARPEEFRATLKHFEQALAKEPPDPDDFNFPGLTDKAYHTLYEQGRRGGPILSVVRLVQSQAMSIRNILVVGERQPEEAYTFDLVGAHPRTEASLGEAFYDDLALRITTAASTHEITQHEILDETISQEVWESLNTPSAMRQAGLELGKRNFFTEMVMVSNLVNAPAVQDAVASQYSEGCFATWDPEINALIATVTGSARPVEKDNLTDDELAVIVAVKPDGTGARVRLVEGNRNDPPSSEAVELIDMDSQLPMIQLDQGWDFKAQVPVARSKLHGHRGVKSYDPERVEHVYLDQPYYHYPVSCSTEAQARAIQTASGPSN